MTPSREGATVTAIAESTIPNVPAPLRPRALAFNFIRIIECFLIGAVALPVFADERGTPWKLHTIDDSSRGADGVRLADVNSDGLLDIATGWEEGGVVRVCLNPGAAKVKLRWPGVTVGQVRSAEDAVLVDLDGDRRLDVVSCCEDKTRQVYVHWAPSDLANPKEPGRVAPVRGESRESQTTLGGRVRSGSLLDEKAWTTKSVPALKDKAMWMFCLPMQIDGKHGIDLVLGGKNKDAEIGWLEAPANPRDLSAWKWNPLRTVGWTMSLIAHDMDGDGDADIVGSDRKGRNRGCFWLENPGAGAVLAKPWAEHRIGESAGDPMFLDLADLDRDGLVDVVVPLSDQRVLFHRRAAAKQPAWETHVIHLPKAVKVGKGARVADIDLDGRLDLVVTTEGFKGDFGAFWLSYRDRPTDADWVAHPISAGNDPKGLKLDRAELLDLDADGDLDVITTEERSSFGVIWWENPTK